MNSRQARHLRTASTDPCMDISHVDRCFWPTLETDLMVLQSGHPDPSTPTSLQLHRPEDCHRSVMFHFFLPLFFFLFPHPLSNSYPAKKKKTTKKWGQQHRCQSSSVGVALRRAAGGLAIPCVHSQWRARGPDHSATQEVGREIKEWTAERDLVLKRRGPRADVTLRVERVQLTLAPFCVHFFSTLYITQLFLILTSLITN